MRAGGHPSQVALPVYLGDTLQWNRNEPDGAQIDLLAGNETLDIFVSRMEGRALHPAALAAVASDARLFDRVLNTMIEYGACGEPADHFAT